MHPELFSLPFTDMTVKSYGVMVVIGFFAAAALVKKMCKHVHINSEDVINATFYTFIVGIVGARVFHVIHYYENFDSLWSMIAVWRGGLEFLGGVIPAVIFLVLYLYFKKMDTKTILDILATALMIGAAFGRIGCFLNGCCFGQPTESSFGVVFPYGSSVYYSQAYPDLGRDREEPIIDLPKQYYGRHLGNGQFSEPDEWNKFDYSLKPLEALSDEQAENVAKGGKYAAKPVHPTQLYDSLSLFIIGGFLIWFWSRFGSGQPHQSKRALVNGSTSAIMLILYSISRFGIEFLRGDNPYEAGGLTVSQMISIGLFVFAIIMLAFLNQNKTVKSK